MSCAPLIPQPSPPSLRMYSANNLLSPCRASADDPPLSLPFSHSPASSPYPASSSAKARSVLTDIVLYGHKISPQSPFGRTATLPSPRKCFKENWDSARHSNAEHEASTDPSRSSPQGRGKRRNVENDIFTLCSSASPRQLTRATTVHYTQLGSPKSTCGREHDRLKVRENGASIDALCSSQSPSQTVTSASFTQLESPQTCVREELDAPVKLQKNGVETRDPNVAFCSSPSPSPLKRRRPAKLTIPEFARLASFGKVKQFELPPQEPLSSEVMSFEDPMFGVSCRKGRRDSMEDTHTATTNFQGKANQAFFGVFDGHGGKSAAQFAAENLGRHIAAAIQNQGVSKESLESAMHAGYLAMDLEFSEKGLDSGACSVSAFVQEGHLVVANAGDCKAVLCRDGKAEALSNFHRASDAKERERIESLGGYVDCFNGVWRVQGTLAVTRGFGDTNLNKWISAEPEVRQLDITKDCEFLVLATDGLWDNLNDQEVVDCAREVLQRENERASADSPTSRPNKVLRRDNDTSISVSINEKKSGHTVSLTVDACNKLIHKACSRGNLDDITVMVVPLENFALSM